MTRRSEAQASITLALMLALVITSLVPIPQRREPEKPPQPSEAAKLLQEPLPRPDREIREIDWSMHRPLIPRSVMTERIRPLPPSTSAVAAVRPVYKDDPDEVARIKPRSRASDDICTRHKRRKVWVSKYKWRCLK
jgi:hypothetical protein